MRLSHVDHCVSSIFVLYMFSAHSHAQSTRLAEPQIPTSQLPNLTQSHPHILTPKQNKKTSTIHFRSLSTILSHPAHRTQHIITKHALLHQALLPQALQALCNRR
jgi:hypothetical protein